jgi:hypothetical protein
MRYTRIKHTNRTKRLRQLSALFTFALPVIALASILPTLAAENLRLRDGISFVRDLNQGFPILGDKLDDATLASGRPTVLFFGASGDLNTNRQAKRIIDLYKKYHQSNVKFIVVDVDRPITPSAKQLIKSHYQGYIPGEVVFDGGGKSTWSKSGEVEVNTIASEIDKVLVEPKPEGKVAAQTAPPGEAPNNEKPPASK